MNFLVEQDEIHNKYLKIAWNAATVGLHPTRIKRRINRNTILSFDIPKSCNLIDYEYQQPMLLQTKACLLYGISKIMRQKTCILYEDSVLLCNKLKFGLTDPLKTANIDMEKPIANLNTLTLLQQNDDLIEFQTSKDAPLFSNLFADNRTRLSERDKGLNEIDESICSILKFMSHSSSFNLPTIDSQQGVYYNYQCLSLQQQNPSHMLETTASHFEQESNLQENNILFDNDLIETGVDDDQHQDFTIDEDRLLNFKKNEDSSVFDLPYHSDINTTSKVYYPSANSYSPFTTSIKASSSGRISIGNHPVSSGNSHPPSLILEEGSLDSPSTEMYPDIVPDDSSIAVSEISSTVHHPRCVRRMMMNTAEDTILPFSHYYQTGKVIRKNENLQIMSKKESIDEIRDSLRLPSMRLITSDQVEATNREGALLIHGEYAFFQNKNKYFYFNQQQRHQYHSSTEFAKSVEKSRRFDRRRNTSGSSSSVSGGFMNTNNNTNGNISIRSSSVDIPTPEMNNLDLGGDNHSDHIPQNNAHWPFNNQFDGGYDFDDNNVDYGYLNFDQAFHIENQEVIEDYNHEGGAKEFLIELRTNYSSQDTIRLDEIFKSRNRIQISQIFYYILVLASKSQIYLCQKEPYDSIDIKL
ncbi:uncharacterized protein BX663DRAFT_557962 [Cokeromyces recurvatus]|uniref:uncharacterized protein n=1 Tax=Cokeromyces recurvatus TaxID=90255 RepID=UPI00221E714C|nr:uncharacterized protein BX663DRAFT_557962 [Cokeromyces recurvatus]KAI7907422.1 hypothetical protein BX663DRAFT_557962 [Cokeromyces recurvatus]